VAACPAEVFDAYTGAEKQKIWFDILEEKPGIVEIDVDPRVGDRIPDARDARLLRGRGPAGSTRSDRGIPARRGDTVLKGDAESRVSA